MRHRRLASLLACGAALVLCSGGCFTLNLGGGNEAPLQEKVVYGERGPKILLLPIDGVISEQPEQGFFGIARESSVARVRAALDKARGDDDVIAVLVRIDTPGGSATASELIYSDLVHFKQERALPVVAQLMGTATSGGYYVAMAADEVIAHPTTVTGSIGVIFLGLNLSGLLEKLGIEDQTITAGTYKDAGSMLRPMKSDERVHFQTIIDDLHARFKEVVVSGREELDAAAVDVVADGRIYSAPQALEMGLVDRIGTLEDAIAGIEARTGERRTRVVTYHRRREYRENLYTQGPPSPVLRIDLGSLLGPLQKPGFHYLWWPGAD